MTQTTPERKPCGTCGEEYTVTAAGGMRHHFTDNPDFQAGPDSRKCRGVGEPPAGAAPETASDDPQCRLCKHPVQLTDNGRVRSHLTPEATPRPCPAGSDFPLGAYPEIVGTTDGLVATLARDCGHVPAGECYACYGAAGNPVSDAELEAMAGADRTNPGTLPWGVDSDTVAQPTMADQLKAAPLTEALAREVGNPGTVLDVMSNDMRAEADRFLAAGIPEQPSSGDGLMDVYGRTKDGGVYCEKCNTDNHRCKGCGEAVKHGLDDVCTDCDRRVAANRLPKGETEDGRPCFHDDAVFGVEDDRMVCVACGTPCTHPDGFQYIGSDENDEDRHACPLCGADDPTDRWDPQAVGVGATITALDAEQAKADEWRTPADMLAKMPEDVQGLDALRLDCATCGHPVTPRGDQFDMYGTPKVVVWGCREGFQSGYRVCRDHECVPNRGVRLGDLDEGDYFTRRGTLMRLAERESATTVLAEVVDGPHKGRTGELKNPDEVVQRAPEPQVVKEERSEEDQRKAWQELNEGWARQRAEQTGPVRVGELEDGEHFMRRGAVMRVTSAGYGLVEAVVVEGPMAGRTGELKNPGETVERTHCRHSFVDDEDAEDGSITTTCRYCDQPKEQETKEGPDDRTATQRPGSSAAAPTAPAPGSKPPTKASAPAVLPESNPVTSSGPTATAAGNGRSAAAMTIDPSAAAARFLAGGLPSATGPVDQAQAAAQFLASGSGAHGEKETKRDRFGRYLIPHPDTGKEKAWTRATTFAKSISDTYALSQWGLRMALLGATVRPDIVQRAHGKHVKADKHLLDELTADLKNAAGDKVAANLGTSMHSFTEMADRAWHTPGGPRSVLGQIPPDCRDMVETYIRLLEETGLEPVPHLIEFTTVVKQYGVAGTSDNCYKVTRPLVLKIGRAEVRLNPGEYVIGDKKTGKDLDYGWQEITIQLATYAQGINTAGVWDRHEEVWEPDPLSRFDKPGTKVRLDAGIVIHLPVDKESEKQPAVYGVDLESGWNAAVLCERVRAWRKVRSLAAPVMVSGSAADTFAPQRAAARTVRSAPMAQDYDPDTGVTTRTTVHPPSLKDRANAVTSNTEASGVWKDAKEAGLSDAEVDELVKTMQARLKELAEPGG